MTPPTNSSSSGAMAADTSKLLVELARQQRAFEENTRLKRVLVQLLKEANLLPAEQRRDVVEILVKTGIVSGSIKPDEEIERGRSPKEEEPTRRHKINEDASQRPAEQRRDERQQHARATNSGSITPDEEFLKLNELRDAKLAKNARVEYINGKKYEWSPGNVAGQRNSSLSSTFAPTPNFYDVLDDAVCTPPVQRSAGPKINREQQKALVVTSPLNDPNLKWAQALAKPKNSWVNG